MASLPSTTTADPYGDPARYKRDARSDAGHMRSRNETAR